MKYFIILAFSSLAPLSTFAQFNFNYSMLGIKCSMIRSNCYQHLLAGCTSSGVYKIRPPSDSSGYINLYCDQQNDGGGWTLVTKIEKNVTPGNLEFEGTVTSNTQSTTISTAPTAANGLNVSDLSGLQNPNLSNRTGYAVKLSNARINALKSSTLSTVAAYRLEKMTVAGNDLQYYDRSYNSSYRKLFYPGACVFKLQTTGVYTGNTACQTSASLHNSSVFSTGTNPGWCNQPTLPAQYFCSAQAQGLLRFNDFYTAYDSHNYFDHLLWVR